jgi:phage tail-like protein
MKNLLLILAVVLISSSSLLAQPKFNFKVKTDKLELKFQEVSGLNIETPTTKSKEGDAPVTPRKLPGIKKNSNVVCKKGMASNTKEMNDFLTSTKRGPITIELLDEQGKTTMSWVLANAYIVKTVKVVDGKDLVIESMDIVHEGLTAIDKK